MRSQKHFSNCHLKNSVNFPVENNDLWRDLVDFDGDKIINKMFTSKEDKEAFKKRKQSMVYIVSHRT